MIITIDGPAASGKSSAAQGLARKLGYFFIGSGALYRALAYLLVHEKGHSIEALAAPRPQDVNELLDPQRFSYRYNNQDGQQILFDGIEIAPYLKSEQIDTAASLVSQDPYVRDRLTQLQRCLAQEGNVVVEGRDSGSVVFPEADHSFYITATVGERASRWKGMQRKRGVAVTQEEAERAITERDERDRTRTQAPLRIPEQALIIDNSGLDLQQTLEKLLVNVRSI